MTKYTLPIVPLLFSCNDTVIEKQENMAPTIVIVSHSDGMDASDGYSETLRATVSDEDHSFEELSVAWFVDDTIVCDWTNASAGGDSNCTIQFSEGNTRVIAQVADPVGAGAMHEISVVVAATEPPTVEIINPIVNMNYYSDQLVQLSANVSDTEDNPEDLIVQWSSSLDGELSIEGLIDSNGMVSDYLYLSEGNHALQVQVEDSSGKLATDEVVIRVGSENTAPSCEITQPIEGETLLFGDPITFRGTATDPDIPATDLQFEWISDKDGSLGDGAITSAGEITFSHTGLSGNNHVITLNIQDEVGAVCQDTVLIVIGTPPTITIDSPLDGALFEVGENISFQGTLTDQEDSLNALAVVWSSSLDGDLETGNSNSQGVTQFSSTNLSSGIHSITLQVTDTSNLITDDTISIHVNTPPTVDTVQLTPTTIYSTDTLTVSSSLSDADGHMTTPYYQWYENGVLTSNTTSSVPSSDLDVGDLWTVRVTPDDGFHAGAYAEASITVANTTPIVQSISISPSSSVYNDTVLSCSAIGYDPDQTLTPTYEWSLNNAVYSGATLDLSTINVTYGDVVTCTATVVDSYGEMGTGTASISVENRAPTITSVTINPNSSVEADALLSCSGTAQDLDNDTLNWTYEWFQNGQSVGTGDTFQLDASQVSPNDNIECLGIVSDTHDTAQSSDSVTIINSLPSIDSIIITPTEPSPTDTVTCSATTSDTNGDTPTLTFAFTNQTSGLSYTATSTTPTDATIDLSTVVVTSNDVLECTVVATDDQGATSSASSSVNVVNPAPTFTQSASITPNTNVVTDTPLTCSATAVDPDGGTVNYTYNWFLGGQTIANGSTFTADSTTTDVGDTIECIVIAVDSDGDVASSTSNSVTIENTLPTVQSATLSPSSVYTNDTISAAVTATDIDGDTVSLTYEWHRIDASLSGADILITSGSGSAFSSITGVDFDRDDQVYVLVTPDDGRGGSLVSPTQSNSVDVLNSAPIGATAGVTGASTPPYDGIDDLTCSLSTFGTDIDADSLTYTYEWIDPNGNIQQTFSNTTDTTDVFLGSGTTPGAWTCQVTTSDGSLSAYSTASITVESLWSGTREFSNCGQTGKSGPSQSQCDSTYSGTTLDGEVTLSAGYQTWFVPSNGTYLIEITGAAGGGYSYPAGYGAYMSGEFSLSAGDEITIVVGQMGEVGGNGGGGGGATFVVLNQSTPLIIAGGGGGSHSNQGTDNAYGGQIGTSGAATSGTGSGYRSGSGGDWFGDGSNGDYSAEGGKGWSNGLTGGVFANVNGHWSRGDGGFGGGGGGCWPAGSGGGYNGGESPDSGGNTTPGGSGGGSYNNGTNQSNTADTNNDHGYVWIERL